MDTKQLRNTLLLMGCSFIWGTAFVAQSVGGGYMGAYTFLAGRSWLACVFLLGLMGARRANQRRKGVRVPFFLQRKTLVIGGLCCGTALFAASVAQQMGIPGTTTAKAGFLTAMYIVLVPVLGIFVHRKPGINAVVSVLLALVGLYLLSFTDMGSINIGDILLTGCALAFAVQILLIDRFAPDLDGLRLNCVQSLVVSLLSVPCIFLNRETVELQTILDCWLPLGFAGIFSMGVAYSMQIIGQKRLEPTAASLIMSLESVFAALGGWLILHNTMTPSELTGCTLVFAGVIVSQVLVHKLFARK